MARQTIIQRTFAGGELAPVLHARADTTKYLSGLRTCRNFLVRREGGVTTRPGLRYVGPCLDNVTGKKLLRYLGTTATTGVLIEAGSGYFRFYYQGAVVTVTAVPAYNNATNYVPGDLVTDTNGEVFYCFAATVGNAPPNGAFWYPLNWMIFQGQPVDVSGGAAYNAGTAYVPGNIVTSGGAIYRCIANTTGHVPPNATFWAPLTSAVYQIPTPYGGVVPIFKWYQSGNVVVITEPGQKPRELVFASLTRWVLRDVSTAPTIQPPSGGAGVAGTAGTRNYSYVVTAAAVDTFEESNASAAIAVLLCTIPTAAAPNTLSWTAQPSAAEFYVYCDPYGNGVYGFIGTASTNAYNDVGTLPDFTLTPPLARILFNSANNYPDNAATYQQRRFYANTNLKPDAVNGSRVGFFANFGISSPVQDDDAVSFQLAGNSHHPVRHMLALKAGLVLLTDGGEWTITGGGGPMTPIAPNSINADQDTYVGVDPNVRPVIVGASILYVQARGSVLRELAFTQGALGGIIPAGRDLTVFASHLFEGQTLLVQDYQQVPDSIIWAVRSDGVLLGLTYLPDEDVWGWHRHDTLGGLIEDICVVPETKQDVLYVLVNRGGTRQIEKLESRIITTFNTDAFFVDAGLSYNGAPATTFSGLSHLEGKQVAILADGGVVSDGTKAAYTVTGGAVTIPAPASVVHIGLPISFAEIETLDLDVHGTQIRDVKKLVTSVSLLLDKSGRTFSVGPDATSLLPYAQQAYEPVTPQFSGLVEIGTQATFTPYGRIFIRQTDPLPLTVLGVLPNTELGG